MSIVFFTMRILPGDPCIAMMGDQATGEALKDCEHHLGLNRPLLVQYGEYLWKSVRFDFGHSFRHKSRCGYILRMFPYTLVLVWPAWSCLAIGLPSGILSALYRRRHH
jgi:peptide/nickel transport system permease protein